MKDGLLVVKADGNAISIEVNDRVFLTGPGDCHRTKPSMHSCKYADQIDRVAHHDDIKSTRSCLGLLPGVMA